MSRFLLFLVSLFNPLWRQAGADTEQLQAILEARLKMDSRRTSYLKKGFKSGGNEKNNSVFIAFANIIMGFFIGIILLFVHDYTSGLTLYFSAWMVFLAMTIITDFTEVLIDVRDNYILLPKPVADRTVTLARILHIFLYLTRQIFFFILPALVILLFKHPAGLPVFLIQCLIASVMVVFLVNAFYLVMLKVTSPQRFRDLINYFQIGFTILIFGAYYTIPKLLDMNDLASLDVLSNRWVFAIPSVWIAAIWRVGAELDFSLLPVGLSLLAILVTGMGAFLVVSVLGRNLNRQMMALMQGGGEQKKMPKPKGPVREALKIGSLAQWLTGSPVENAAFQFSWTQITRARDYKLKTFPSLAFIPILFIYMAINSEGTLSERLADIQKGHKYLILIYLCMLAIASPILNTMYSERSQGAWLFRSTPVERPGELVTGTVKAVLILYILPVYFLAFLAGFAIWGFHVWDDFLYGLVILCLFSVSVTAFGFEKLPFSGDWNDYNKGNNIAVVLVSMMALAVLGLLHFLLVDRPGWLVLAGLIAGSFILLVYRRIQQVSWKRFRY